LRHLFKNALTFGGNAVVHPLARGLRRDPNLWVFGAGNGRFEGNSKYLYLWLNLMGHSPKPVWITDEAGLARRLRERGMQALTHWSGGGLRTAARAGVYFVNDSSSDVNFPLSSGAVIFNLWHGVGLKNVLFGAKVGVSARLAGKRPTYFQRIRNMRRLQRPDWILSTSPEMSETFFARCFDVPTARAPALGYPRLDPQLDEKLRAVAMDGADYSALDERNGRRTILYAPTLRESGSNFLEKALPDLAALSAALTAQDAHLFLKLHPKMPLSLPIGTALPANVSLLPEGMDLYPVLDRFDALVTDYSSLFFDYIASRSDGVVLYTFDHDGYLRTERDLAWDYDEATVGVRAPDFRALCAVIADGRAFAPLDPVKLATLRERFWGGPLQRPLASERILEFLKSAPAPWR
jgi:CDP-glycerol glycerophosphotransferase (TagB/SpsB family)